MRNAFFFLCFGVTLLSRSAKAQLQIMPSINLLSATGSSFAGGSLSGRYFVSPHLAMGINLAYIPQIDLVMTTLEADYFFLKGKLVRPYIGLEGGLYRDLYTTTKAPGIAPKVGLQYRLTSLLALQVDAGYPIAIHKGESLGSDSGLLVGVGLNFMFGNR